MSWQHLEVFPTRASQIKKLLKELNWGGAWTNLKNVQGNCMYACDVLSI